MSCITEICIKNIRVLVDMKHNVPKQYVHAGMIIKQKYVHESYKYLPCHSKFQKKDYLSILSYDILLIKIMKYAIYCPM
jgi:hypothetical protein